MAIFIFLSSPSNRGLVAVALCVIQLVVCFIAPVTTWAATIISGKVVDQTTSSVVPGASVSLTSGSASLGQGATNRDGQFVITFESDSSSSVQNLSLMVEHREFEPGSEQVRVDRGRPDKLSYEVPLIPLGLGRCKLSVRGVSVGYFEQEKFAEAITATLIHSLRPQIQMVSSLKTFEPDIKSCANAKPESQKAYVGYAQVLGADVLLGGRVKLLADLQHGDVKILVGDRYGLFPLPLTIEHKNMSMSLYDAEASQLDPRTNGAILMAIAKGLELDKKYQQCVDLLGVAERMAPTVVTEAKPIREACEAGLPNRGLLRGRTP